MVGVDKIEDLRSREGARGQGRVERTRVPSSNRDNENRNEVRSEGCPCPHHHHSCIHRHKVHAQYPHPPNVAQHCRDPQSRMTRAYAVGPLSSSSSSSVLRGCDAIDVVCSWGVSPLAESRVFSVWAAVLPWLRESGNDIGGDVVPLRPKSSPPRGAGSSGDGGERYSYLLESGSGGARHDSDPLLLPLSIHRRSWVPPGPLCYCSHDYFANRDRHASVSAGRGSRAYRRGHVRLEQ